MIPIGGHKRVKSFFTEPQSCFKLGKLGKKSRVVRKQFGSSNKTEKEFDFYSRIRNSSFQIFGIYRQICYILLFIYILIFFTFFYLFLKNYFFFDNSSSSMKERELQVHRIDLTFELFHIHLTRDSFKYILLLPIHKLHFYFSSGLLDTSGFSSRNGIETVVIYSKFSLSCKTV